MICYNTFVKLLNGKEIAEYIQARQARDVRALRQAWHVQPRLAIVLANENPVTNTYTRLKEDYGTEILIDVVVHRVQQDEAAETILRLNGDPTVHGIIVQLPLARPDETDKLINLVAPEKDVDALGEHAPFDAATPMAILWLLAGYNVDLQQGKKVVLVGHGTLVGKPLARMLKASEVDVTVVDRDTEDAPSIIKEADVIITATGQPGLITSSMLKERAVVVDAGVAGEQNKTVGDLADDVYGRDDLTITPKKGGVGPLTVCALFENVIRAARPQ
jgi:methylenetetrahydrofolate dehydrogenase (NADP+)/methenyltetrahydrofolate cyclohydrolase